MNSVNHHYVPKFYLQGFTSDNGRLQVYNKTLCKFERDKHTPKTVLFEKNLNTIKMKGKLTDDLEKLYGYIETRFSEYVSLIRSRKINDEIISKEGILLIKQYIAFQFWRLPCYDAYADEYIASLDLSKFGEKLIINENYVGKTKNIKEMLKSDSGFKHYFRCFILPLISFDFTLKYDDLSKWKYHQINDSGWNNLPCSDNPLLIENLTGVHSFNTKIIFPVSNTQLISYSPDAIKSRTFDATFSAKLCMLIYAQANKYFIGTNKEQMEKVIDLYKNIPTFHPMNLLKKDVFDSL
ncbi:DUF4238 domain-containing protein [Pseudoalteromonas sp. C8]|uniref:DUF4238 domain-containing protein n=1 Tax=Pseudoalteromonas sp. C8 TaxID=2686345 RepID=UPI0013FD9BB1|nr:DUF4238 domain-containing protein [Pseudoalteromonas sp. C8]